MSPRLIYLALIASIPVLGYTLCEPAPDVRAEMRKVEGVAWSEPGVPPADFDGNLAPFLALRNRWPDDLFAHERYQDAVHRYGIEGHLRSLTQEYQTLSIQHAGDLRYQYLYIRTLMGRNTRAAIQELDGVIAGSPEFAPAHRTLSEIYASEAFRDPEKGRTERERFLALCPGSMLTTRPAPLPDPSPLVDQAERRLEKGDLEGVAEMAMDGIRADEWRLQRIRPFDWFSVEFKRWSQLELQAKYWRAWSIQARCDRKAGHQDKAAAQLALMEERSRLLKGSDQWNASAMLLQLYAEGKQMDQAARKLEQMQQLLDGHPDRAAQLEQLRKFIGGQ